MPIDVSSLWDFSNPALSEERFLAALAEASGDNALVLQTQIARTHGLRRDFARARELLASIEPQLAGAGAEARVRHALEYGRTLSSATHPPESQTPDVKAQARSIYLGAIELAKREQLDALAIDALHMLGFVDTDPLDQLRVAQEALALAAASKQRAAQKWEGTLRNNVGCALHGLGRYEEALNEFERALVLRERGTNAEATRIAHWMIAWTLRSLHRSDEALEIQLRLERECDAAGAPDPFVFEELETLYRARGDADRADLYAERKAAVPQP